MQPPSRIATLAGGLLLALASAAVAHDHDDDMEISSSMPDMLRPTLAASSDVPAPETYFNYGEHAGFMTAHILLMTISWVFILPIGALMRIWNV
jgi:hypothetical protein